MIITRKQLTEALVSVGWVLDKYGHPTKSLPPPPGQVVGPRGLLDYRVRLDNSGCQVETKSTRTPTAEDPSRTSWRLVEKVSYSGVTITSSGQIKIGSKYF